MQVTVTPQGADVAVVRPTGRIDLESAAELKRRLTQEIAGGRTRIVVDLSEVPFIDSSGLGALVGGLKAAKIAGGDLRIARPSDQAKVVLELTSLNRVLRPYGTVEEALAGSTA